MKQKNNPPTNTDNNPPIDTNIRPICTNLLVFIGFILVFISGVPSEARAASLYFSPPSGTYTVGENFSVSVLVSSTNQAMNAASATISFPKDKLQVVSISKTGSIFNLWVQEPVFSNSFGTVNFEGIVLNPGFAGSDGKILTIGFRALAPGTAPLTFSSGSVLANDGNGTQILKTSSSANFQIVTPVAGPTAGEAVTPSPVLGLPSASRIASPTHPDPEKWYSNSSPKFTWEVPKDATAVRLLYDKNPSSRPSVVYDPPISEKQLEDIADGVWYFHLQFRNRAGWGEISHFRFQIDTEPPQPFKIVVDNEGDPTNPAQILYFRSEDKVSGVAFYEVRELTTTTTTTLGASEDNPFRLPVLPPGRHTVIVEAVDAAGNKTPASAEIVVEPLETPLITEFPQKIGLGEALTIKGTSAYPESEIEVFVKKEGEEAQVNKVKADGAGNWVYVHPGSLTKGVYQIWVQVIDKRGARSYPTDKITVEVALPALLKFGKIAIDYLMVIVTLIILAVGAVAVIFYIWYQISVWRKRMRKETQEVSESVGKAFRALREEVEEQVEMLDKKPGMSKSEKEVRDKLQEALDISEEFIGKEIKDVEKELE